MGVGARLNRVRERMGPSTCANPAPCRIIVTTELAVYPDCEERLGAPPPPLCATCPEHESSRPHVRWVEVRKDYRKGRAEAAASAATLSHAAPVAPERGTATERATDGNVVPEQEPDDGLAIPPAWRGRTPPALTQKRPRHPRRGAGIATGRRDSAGGRWPVH